MNTDHNINNLSLAELDSLSRAYLDCRLTKLEEKELQLVLMSTNFSSPAIDEARETMGVTTVMESLAAPAPKRVRRRPAWLKWCAAAACIALAVGVAVNLPQSDRRMPDTSVIVYVDGHKLDNDEAARKASETQARCMAMLEHTLNQANAAQNAVLNQLNPHND